MQDNRFSFDKECVLLVCSLIGCVFGGGGGGGRVSPPVTDLVSTVKSWLSLKLKVVHLLQPRKKAW